MTQARLGGIGLACALIGIGASAEDWVQVGSPHFRVISNAGTAEAVRVATEFEQYRAAFPALVPTARLDTALPVVVFACANARTLQRLLPDVWAAGAARPGGIFVSGPTATYVALRLDVPAGLGEGTIHHEYVHHLLRLNFARLPLWVEEGYAEMLTASGLERRKIVVGTHVRAHTRLLRDRQPMTFATLIGVDRDSAEYQDNSRLFYAQSWASVHYFAMADQGRHSPKLNQYLAQANSAVSGVAAAEAAFGDLATLGQRIYSYASNGRFASVTVRADFSVPRDSIRTRALSSAELEASIGDFHLQRGRDAAARDSLEQAIELDPTVTRARVSLAFLDWRDGDLETARKRLARAMRETPEDPLAHYVRAVVLLAGPPSHETRDDARTSLLRALELNDSYAIAHAALAQLLAVGDEIQASLHHAERAVELEPGEVSHHEILRRLRTRSGRVDTQAPPRRLLAPQGKSSE